MALLELVLAGVGLAGTVGTFYYGRKAARLARERHTYTWDDVLRGCRRLVKAGLIDFQPDFIVCFSGPSGVVANLLVELSRTFLPVYVVSIEPKGLSSDSQQVIPDYRVVETSKWRLHIPAAILAARRRRALLVDDVVMTGDSISNLRSAFIQVGFEADNVRTCALICSTIARDSNKGPDACAYVSDVREFYLPWGEGY